MFNTIKKIILSISIIAVLCTVFVGCADNGGSDNSSPHYVTVMFDSCGGSDVPSKQVLKGNTVAKPDTPLRDGYFFAGWFINTSDSNTEWHFDTDRVNGNITLYACWSIIDNEPTNGLVYKRDGDAYTVTGMSGEQTVVVIPSEYEGLPVTKIQGEYGTGAFARKAITSVTVPDSVVEIGQNSFHNCSDLKTVVIGTASKLSVIGNNAFSGNSSLTEMYIPAGTVELGDSVFNNCGAIERFIVAESNAAYRSENGHLIEKSTAKLVRGANNKTVPDGVKVIAAAAFRKSTVTELVLPHSIERIDNYIIADSGINVIRYIGTQDDWDNVEKANLWNFGKNEIPIECLQETDKEITEMFITINGNKLTVKLEKNSSVDALVELLKQGDIVYIADDYGDWEKVGALGHSLPTSNTQITAVAGDVILYNGNQIVLFYGNNSWSYTRIGKIDGYTVAQLRDLLGAGKGKMQVTLSINRDN